MSNVWQPEFKKKKSGRKNTFLQIDGESCFDDFWKKVIDSNFFGLFFSHPTQLWIIHKLTHQDNWSGKTFFFFILSQMFS